MTNKAVSTRVRRPARWVSVIVAVVVGIGLIGGGWFAASVFTSPEQRAAAAAPPAAAPILAEVESGDLLDTRTLSGTIRPTDAFDAVLVAAGGASRSVVTSLNVAKGASVEIGSVVATINGQPVFALQSPFPLYRDIGVGDSGVDVRSLQDSLKSMGLLSSADGTFGPATASAVTKLFTEAAFDTPKRDAQPTPGPETGAQPPNTGGAGTDAPEASAENAAVKPVRVVYFPMAAGMMVPNLPAVVGSLPNVGTEVGAGATFSFTAQALAVFTSLPASLPEGLKAGTKVTVSGAGLQDAAATVRGPVTSQDTGSMPGGSSAPGNGDPEPGAADSSPGAAASVSAESEVRIDLDDTSLMTPQLTGQSVTVTATVKEVATDALIVPVTAVAGDDAAHGHVLVVSGGGAAQRVSVTIIGAVDGRVAIEPGGRLKAGDQVRVG
jgi:hypothetical protein